MTHTDKLCSFVKRLHCCVVLKVKVQQKFKLLLNFHLDHIVLTDEPFENKLDMVKRRYEPQCHAEKKWFAIFKVKVTEMAPNEI